MAAFVFRAVSWSLLSIKYLICKYIYRLCQNFSLVEVALNGGKLYPRISVVGADITVSKTIKITGSSK